MLSYLFYCLFYVLSVPIMFAFILHLFLDVAGLLVIPVPVPLP